MYHVLADSNVAVQLSFCDDFGTGETPNRKDQEASSVYLTILAIFFGKEPLADIVLSGVRADSPPFHPPAGAA